MRKNVLNTSGFTLIELMIVIAIIAILATVSLIFYMNYRAKAKVTSYALPYARFCAIDIIAYCEGNSSKVVHSADLAGCNATFSTPVGQGNLTVKVENTSCSSFIGSAGSHELVEASITSISAYKAVCSYTNSSSVCGLKLY